MSYEFLNHLPIRKTALTGEHFVGFFDFQAPLPPIGEFLVDFFEFQAPLPPVGEYFVGFFDFLMKT
jgi:hypothetical protein